MHQPAASQFLTEDGTEQRVPTEAPHLGGPPPTHEVVVEEQLLHPPLMGQELLGAPVIAVGRLQFASSIIDPRHDRRCGTRLSRRFRNPGLLRCGRSSSTPRSDAGPSVCARAPWLQVICIVLYRMDHLILKGSRRASDSPVERFDCESDSRSPAQVKSEPPSTLRCAPVM